MPPYCPMRGSQVLHFAAMGLAHLPEAPWHGAISMQSRAAANSAPCVRATAEAVNSFLEMLRYLQAQVDVLRTETMLIRKEKGVAAKAISQRLHQSGKLQSKANTLWSKQVGADEDGQMRTQVRQSPSPCHSHLGRSSSML